MTKTIYPQEILNQRKEAQAVKDDGFEGLQLLIRFLEKETWALHSKLVESNDPQADIMLKAEIRVMEKLIKKYMGYMNINTD